MAEGTKFVRGKVREMQEEELQGLELSKITCRSCSGYGNCGFKTYHLYKGKVVSICNNKKTKLLEERDGKTVDAD